MFDKASSSRMSVVAAAFILVVALGVLALGPTGSSEVHAQTGEEAPGFTTSASGFGRQIAGTWVETGDGFSTIINVRADGTLSWWGSWFFGDGTGEFLDGPVFGTWKRTGVREISTIELGHLNNGDGSFFASGRVQQVFTFDREFESFNYEGFEDLFAPGQDPTDPDEVPFDSFGFAGGPIERLDLMSPNDSRDDAGAPAQARNGMESISSRPSQ